MSSQIPTFEEVDKIVSKADLSAFKGGRKRGAARSGARGAEAALAAPDICGIYKTVRPILQLLAATPFIPAKWKEVIKTFISTMDMFCPQS